jgi:hypothetical protein
MVCLARGRAPISAYERRRSTRAHDGPLRNIPRRVQKPSRELHAGCGKSICTWISVSGGGRAGKMNVGRPHNLCSSVGTHMRGYPPSIHGSGCGLAGSKRLQHDDAQAHPPRPTRSTPPPPHAQPSPLTPGSRQKDAATDASTSFSVSAFIPCPTTSYK